jgi:YNFM family putative membrane transporter
MLSVAPVAAEPGHAKSTPAYRRLTLAMLFAGFSTFSLLYSVQPLLPLFRAISI